MKDNMLSWLRSKGAVDIGLLVLRLVVGVSFVVHGYPKITGGVEKWTGLGGAMGVFGITFFPAFWGFMASMAEFVGGIALVVGAMTRLAALFLGFTMVVATAMHLAKGDGFNRASHPAELLAVCALLVLAGAGFYSIDRCLVKKTESLG